MFQTDILTLIFLCFLLVLLALCYLVFYTGTEETAMKRRKRLRSMSKQLNSKSVRSEVARFYSSDKQTHQNMSSFSSEYGDAVGATAATTDVERGACGNHSKRDSVGNLSLKAIKEIFKPQQRQPRYSLQHVSLHHSYENEHTPFNQSNQGMRLVFGLQTPPLNITKPQAVQPDNKMFAPKQRLIRAFSESCTTKLINPDSSASHADADIGDNKKFCSPDNETRRGAHLPKLSEPNLDRHIYPWLSRNKFNTAVFQADKSITSSSESMWSEARRRLSSTEKLFDPVMRILSTIPLKHPSNIDTTWTNFVMNPETNGHICFSLVYTCTLSTLNVTINRLIGVNNLIKGSHILPSQTPTNFVVSLRLRRSERSSIYKESEMEERKKIDLPEESDGFHKKYFTQPVLTSFNPNFDQSFVFPITLNELRKTELVLTVLQSTTMSNPVEGCVSAESSRIPRRNNSVTSYHHPHSYGADKCSRRVNMISEEMRCIGVTFYKLNQHELINCPEKMQNIWQELRKLPELKGGQFDIGSDNEISKSTASTISANNPFNYEPVRFTLNKEEHSVDETENENTMSNIISSVPQSGTIRKSMAKVSILYKRELSILEISVEEFKDLKIHNNETEMIFQALFCLGNTTLSVVKGKPFKINKLKNDKAVKDKDEAYGFFDVTIPYTEHISLNVDMNRLLSYNNIGVLFQIFVRPELSNQSRRLANISVGETKVTYEMALLQWGDLVKELKRLKNDNLFTSTKKITYWHSIDVL
ncbi:unnamed protein product [Trichobilharzia szidati]|nr:unnamed protein product [Trichobilharzia szidati]